MYSCISLTAAQIILGSAFGILTATDTKVDGYSRRAGRQRFNLLLHKSLGILLQYCSNTGHDCVTSQLS